MYNFNVEKTTKEIIQWVKDWFSVNGNGCNAIVGISGGKDSSVVAALCVEALGKDRVVGVLMPNGVQNDISDSMRLIKHLDIRFVEVNIQDACNDILDNIGYIDFAFISNRDRFENVEISKQTKINLPARIRMTTLYAISQSTNGRVANTCNLSEDWVGYSTRYGDAAGDFSPLSQLTTDEVIAVGEYLGLPKELTRKTPSDGLCGKIDEDNLGFTYEVLNKYIRTGVCKDEEIKEKIDNMHKKNLFKLQLMPCYQPKDLLIAIK